MTSKEERLKRFDYSADTVCVVLGLEKSYRNKQCIINMLENHTYKAVEEYKEDLRRMLGVPRSKYMDF